jgi:hypothetical protein
MKLVKSFLLISFFVVVFMTGLQANRESYIEKICKEIVQIIYL